jgi:hypothetical protein
MAEGVVDEAEVVEVQHDEGQRLVQGAARGELSLDGRSERLPAQRPRQDFALVKAYAPLPAGLLEGKGPIGREGHPRRIGAQSISHHPRIGRF